MRKEPAIETTSPATLTVRAVSPHQEDHLSLEAIIGHSRWTLLKADKLPSAWALLQAHDIPVVLCESDLKPGTWIDMLKDIQGMPTAPALIVTSRLADDYLWAEALNLGAWDVLPKPFDRSEVLRSVKTAWQHWRYQIQVPALPLKVMTAAS